MSATTITAALFIVSLHGGKPAHVADYTSMNACIEAMNGIKGSRYSSNSARYLCIPLPKKDEP